MRAAIRSKSADHLRQNEADSATADEHDFVQNLHGITANAAHSVAERKGILKHLASIKRTKGQLPESVDHLGKHLVLGDISAKKTHDAVQRSDVSPSAKMFSSPVGSKGISSRLANAVNSHDEKTSHDNSAGEKTKVKDNGGSVGWIEKLQKEAFRLGYALVRNHESLAESESGGREKNTDHENHKSAESVVLPPMKMLRERESVQNTSIDRVLHVGQSLHTEKTSVRGDPAPTKRDGVRKQNTSSYVSDRIDRDNQIQSMNKEEENSFVWKDSARLQNQARIEAAMHARLQAEAKNSIEHFHSDVISKAVQAQTAAMDAIQRYANVLTFHDREEDKARFEKLALGLSPAERTGDTIRKKIRSYEELRRQAGKEGDKQLKGYAFLEFSDDGIHQALAAHKENGHVVTSKSTQRLELGTVVQKRLAREEKSLTKLQEKPTMQTARMEWNGHGIPRFGQP